jgi:hypothetical protein
MVLEVVVVATYYRQDGAQSQQVWVSGDGIEHRRLFKYVPWMDENVRGEKTCNANSPRQGVAVRGAMLRRHPPFDHINASLAVEAEPLWCLVILVALLDGSCGVGWWCGPDH